MASESWRTSSEREAETAADGSAERSAAPRSAAAALQDRMAPIDVAPDEGPDWFAADEAVRRNRWSFVLGAGALLVGGVAVWSMVGNPAAETSSSAAPAIAAPAPVTTVPGAATTLPTSASTTVAVPTTVDPAPTPVPASLPSAVVSTTVAPVVDPLPATTAPAVRPAGPATTAAGRAPVLPPPTTVAPVPQSTAPAAPPVAPATAPSVEGPHNPNDPAVGSLSAYVAGALTIGGRVPDQATADRIVARASAFLPANPVNNALTVDPAAPPALPLFVIDADDVFDHDTSTIRLEFSPAIVAMATAMTQNPALTLDVYVHTDAHASLAATLTQTRRQADALKAVLVAQGVDAARVQTFAKGISELLGDGSTVEGRNVDRRIEIVVNGLYA